MVLLTALRAQRAYVPDPVDTMMIVAPAEFLAACDGTCITSGACGTLTAALAAAISSIGIPCAVVAQAFNSEEDIQHVLVAVQPQRGAWYYAEPSEPRVPFGSISASPTHEVWLSVPGAKVLCDMSPDCFRAMQGRQAQLTQPRGDTIGIGVGEAVMDAPPAVRPITWYEELGLFAFGALAVWGIWRLGRMAE
jgi:hypothetical protein